MIKKSSKIKGAAIGCKGSVMVEYVMVISFFMIVLWYAIVGGTGDVTDPVGAEGTGQAVDRIYDNPPAYQGVAHALREKERTFQSRLYQP